jgi:hypothetical protein
MDKIFRVLWKKTQKTVKMKRRNRKRMKTTLPLKKINSDFYR